MKDFEHFKKVALGKLQEAKDKKLVENMSINIDLFNKIRHRKLS